MPSGILLYYAGSSSPELCDNLEEWDGVGGPRGKGHVHAYGWFMLMYGRNQHTIIKQFSSN